MDKNSDYCYNLYNQTLKEKNMDLIINRLKECRDKLGISKQETARRIGISQPAYLRYESGDRKPSLQMTKEIAKVLNTSVDYLIGESDDNNPILLEVCKNENKELFRIVELCSQMDEKQQKRIITYINKLDS